MSEQQKKRKSLLTFFMETTNFCVNKIFGFPSTDFLTFVNECLIRLDILWWRLRAWNRFNSFLTSSYVTLPFVIIKNALHWQTHLSVEGARDAEPNLWHFYDISTRWRGILCLSMMCMCCVVFPLSLFISYISCLKYIVLHSSASYMYDDNGKNDNRQTVQFCAYARKA